MTTEYLNNKAFESIICRFQESKRNKSKYELLIEDLQESKERKGKRKANQDGTSQNLEACLIAYRAAVFEFEDSQKQLANAFYILSENIVRYAKFNLIDADDAVQEGVVVCFEKIARFDPQKGKAFNYLTTCVLNQLRQQYRSARNYTELKRKYQEFMVIREPQVLKNKRKTKV